MKKIILLILMSTTISLSYGQKCDCLSNLKWLEETFEKNDAGFQYVIDKKGENAYLAHKKLFEEKASKIQDKNECLQLLNDWTEFFRKNHLQVVLNEQSNSSNNQKELSEKEIKNLYKDSPKFNINKKKFDEYVNNLDNKSGFEGIWVSEPYTIGIIKDNKNPNREFVGFIIESQTPYWQKNQIKLEIIKNENDGYDMKYYMLDHSFETIKNIEIVGNNYILAGFIGLKRLNPIYKTDKKEELYFKTISAEEPFIEKISDNTVLLRIPSFRINMKWKIDSLLDSNNKLITNTKKLIIDLRNNGGGSDASFEHIIPYLYTNPIRIIGMKYLSTKLNNQRMEDYLKTPGISKKDKEWLEKSLKKLNKHMGEFINLDDKIINIDTLDTIYPYPEQIAILINQNCASTTEQFLLAAKQSKKVKLFGTTTIGALDISNMYSVKSPCEEYTLWYGLSKSYRIPEMTIDEKGIQPDFYFDKTIKPYDWITKTLEILNYK